MGTNHYARAEAPKPCPTCDHTPPQIDLHISKSYVSFQGYREADGTESPYGDVTSVKDWAAVLRGERSGPALRVFSEYGDEWDVEEFLTAVYNSTREERSRPYRWMVDHYPPEQREKDWQDAEGFSFHSGDFF
jgi:hypothetical protein